MLTPARVEIIRGGVGDVASSVIGHDGDVIAYLLLYWPTLEWIKGVANRYVRRPSNTTVGAVRVE